MTRCFRSASLFAALAFSVISPSAASTVLVGHATQTENIDCSPACTSIIQTVYSSSYFGSTPGYINSVGLHFLDGNGGQGTFTLSTSVNPVGSLSLAFFDNVGTDATVLSTGSTISDSDGFTIFSGTPFYYDPTLGDLLLQIDNGSGGASYSYETNAERAYLYGAEYSGPSGYAFDTKFDFTAIATSGAVPEPSTWAMMLLGFGAIGFATRRNRKRLLSQVA